jgi:hypothetical protein
MNISEICELCMNEDFGSCLSNSPKIKENVMGNIIKCSNYVLDEQEIYRRFKLKDGE